MPPKKSSRSKGKPGKPPKSPGDRLHLRVALALLFVLGFLVASMVGLSYMRESLQVMAPSQPLPFEEPVFPARHREVVDDIRVELESALLRSGLSLTDLKARQAPDGRTRIEIHGKVPSPTVLGELERRLSRIDGEIRLISRPAAQEMDILWRGVPRFSLHFRPPSHPRTAVRTPPSPVPSQNEVPAPRTAGPARLSIIMDDLGRDLDSGNALLAIDVPVAFAIMPGNAQAAAVADLAHRHGREVLIHMPMEPRDYPAMNPGTDALLVRMNVEEVQERVRGFLDRVPHAVGGNNHMGSRFTEDPAGMQAVLAVLKESGLFFVDSMTSRGSIAVREARQAGVATAGRDVFLDNEQDVERIAAEIRHLVGVARRQGEAIGICHPYPETLEALRREADALKQSGVEIVPVSRLVR